MSNIVQINVSNQMSDGVSANPAFDLKLYSTVVLTAGTTMVEPSADIKSMNAVQNTGAGAYGGAGSPVRGIVAYTIPGAKTVLVIYFDTAKCYVDTVAPGTILSADIVNAAALKKQAMFTGALVIGSDVYTYTVHFPWSDPWNRRADVLLLQVKAQAHAVAKTQQCIVTLTASG